MHCQLCMQQVVLDMATDSDGGGRVVQVRGGHAGMLRFWLVLMGIFMCRAGVAEVDFAHDVVPILKQHCAECHAGEEAEGGFSLNTPRLLQEADVIVPGQPGQSPLIERIVSGDPDERMPPADRDPLTDEQISILKQWVTEGTPWEPGFRFGSAGYEPPLLPRQVTLPPEQFPGQHPLDRLLAPYLHEHEIPAPAELDDRVFHKRVSMDLLGLLPTIEEQDQFLQDTEPDRRRRLIDALLSRDHDYAEHWMTFWNDLLRNDYKGTGYIDGGRRQISAWLYAALVNNRPYDEFVRQLIAPQPESEGFIRGIKWRGDVNASQVREIQFAQNVGQVFLGINIKCASCHDSFIDRWTLDESYGLAAIYSERELEIHRCDKPTGRIAKAAWLFPELGQVDAEAPQPERLKQLASLITHPDNGRFSRTIVNRLWHRLMGRGIVHPVDAMHTRPWNDDLLEYLAGELVTSGYDLRHMLRLIATSQAYQSPTVSAEDPATADKYIYRGPLSRHLTAEQFLDGVWQLTGTAPESMQAPIPMNVYAAESVDEGWQPGQWIWAHDQAAQAAAGETVVFRRELTLSELPKKATCVLTCDNEYTLIVNGTEVRSDSRFTEPDLVGIGPYLQVGQNQLIVRGRNAGNSPNPAGLYVDVVLLQHDDSLHRISSGPGWDAVVVDENGKESGPSRPATLVANQRFLGDDVHNRIVDAVQRTLVGTVRPVRASMLTSNLLMRSLGRPNREQVVTTRPESLSTLQAIDLANGEILDRTLAAGANRLLPTAGGGDDFVQTMFLRALCRPPTAQEHELATELLGSNPDAAAVQDLLWTLIMLPEFQFVN